MAVLRAEARARGVEPASPLGTEVSALAVTVALAPALLGTPAGAVFASTLSTAAARSALAVRPADLELLGEGAGLVARPREAAFSARSALAEGAARSERSAGTERPVIAEGAAGSEDPALAERPVLAEQVGDRAVLIEKPARSVLGAEVASTEVAVVLEPFLGLDELLVAEFVIVWVVVGDVVHCWTPCPGVGVVVGHPPGEHRRAPAP